MFYNPDDCKFRGRNERNELLAEHVSSSSCIASCTGHALISSGYRESRGLSLRLKVSRELIESSPNVTDSNCLSGARSHHFKPKVYKCTERAIHRPVPKKILGCAVAYNAKCCVTGLVSL